MRPSRPPSAPSVSPVVLPKTPLKTQDAPNTQVTTPATEIVPSKAAEAPVDELLNWGRWRLTPGEDRGDRWAYATCPRCHSQGQTDAFPTVLSNLDVGTFFCAQCGHHGDASLAPSQYRGNRVDLSRPWWTPLSDKDAAEWMSTHLPKGLSTASEIGLGKALVEDEQGNLAWQEALVLPCRLSQGEPIVSLMFLPLTSTGGFLTPQDLPGTDPTPWGWSDMESDSSAVFVDHPLDRMAMEMAGVANVICLPPRINPLLPGGGDWSVLSSIEKPLQSIGRVVMAMRDDESGRHLEEELARRIGKDRCFRVRWQNVRVPEGVTCAHTVLREFDAVHLKEAVEKAPAFPVAGVHELYDVEESFEVLYEFGLQPGVSTGWPSLDLYYTVKLGQWTVVTGIPGHGKTTLVDALAVNLAQMHNWRFGVFSPESLPVERHYASLMEKAAGAPFNEGTRPRISVETKNKLKGWLNEHFKIILPDEESGNWTVDGILALARTLVYRHGIRGLIIDPWSELNHMRPPHISEADYVAMELTKIRRFARTYGVHVWVVVHPNKQEKGADGKYSIITPYMLAGGSNWRNKADNILSGFRNLLQVDEEITDIYIQKIRFKECGRLGRASLRGDAACGQFIDDIDQGKREQALRAPSPIPTAQLRTTVRKVRTGVGMPIEPGADSLPTTYI